MRKRLGIAIRVAALGFGLGAATSWASVGAAPVDVSNGTVKLTCSDANRILAKDASGDVGCKTALPAGTTQTALVYTGTSFLSTQYKLQTFASGYLSDVTAPTHSPIGCALDSGLLGSGDPTVSVAIDGEATCLKAASAITIGDRVGNDPADNGKLKTVGTNESAVGIAMETKAVGDANIKVLVGADVAGDPVTVPVVNFATDGACDTAVLSPALSPVLIASPGSVTVPTNGVVLLTGTVGLSDLGGTGARTLTLGVYRGGTLLTNGDVALTRTATDEPSTMSIAISDQPGAGAFTYTLRISTDGPAANSTVSRCWLTALAVD